MLNGLIDIYDNWKNQLDKLGQKYYLKIWFFEPRFSQSQVVCAIGDSLDFYENTFYKPDTDKTLQPGNYGNLKTILSEFYWDYHFDEDPYVNNEFNDPESYASRLDNEESQKWFDKLLKKPHRTDKYKEPGGDTTEVFFLKRGDIWLGEKK